MIIANNMYGNTDLPPLQFLGSGQSNMLGAVVGVPEPQYRETFNAVDYEGAPMDFDTNYEGADYGFDLALFKELNEQFQTGEFYYEKDAESGVGFPFWLTPANLDRLKSSYGALQTRTAGIEGIKNIFLWVLNTNPSVTLSEAETVKSDFTTLVSELENAHGEFDKIIVGYTGDIPVTQYSYLVRTQYIEWLAENPNKGVGWDLKDYTFFDGIHFNEQSCYQMGKDLVNIIRDIY